MKRIIARITAALLLLLVAFPLMSTTASADVDLLVTDKTNKLTLGDSMDECFKGLEASLAAGKSITYKINVPKGLLYIRIADYTDFIVEVYNSKNEEVMKIESITDEKLFGDVALASGGVELSKGKYKIKISPKDKNSELKLSGIVSMLKTNKSISISLNKQYNIAVKEGSTYKFKFTLKGSNQDSLLEFSNFIQSFDPEEFVPYIQECKLTNSKGETIYKFDGINYKYFERKDGIYTLEIKAGKTGILATHVKYIK